MVHDVLIDVTSCFASQPNSSSQKALLDVSGSARSSYDAKMHSLISSPSLPPIEKNAEDHVVEVREMDLCLESASFTIERNEAAIRETKSLQIMMAEIMKPIIITRDVEVDATGHVPEVHPTHLDALVDSFDSISIPRKFLHDPLILMLQQRLKECNEELEMLSQMLAQKGTNN